MKNFGPFLMRLSNRAEKLGFDRSKIDVLIEYAIFDGKIGIFSLFLFKNLYITVGPMILGVC